MSLHGLTVVVLLFVLFKLLSGVSLWDSTVAQWQRTSIRDSAVLRLLHQAGERPSVPLGTPLVKSRAGCIRQGWGRDRVHQQLCCSRIYFTCFAQSLICVQHCGPMDCRPPGSSVHGVSQTRILEGWPLPPPGDLPDPGITFHLLHWQADSSPGKPKEH